MEPVIIESPYAGNVESNLEYARKCIKHSLSLGEAPLASHLLYTQKGVLDDTVAEEREQGIQAGFAWANLAKKHVFYIDKGLSKGMEEALKYAIDSGHIVEFREILKESKQQQTSMVRNLSERLYEIKTKKIRPYYAIGVDDYDKNNLTYCFTRRVGKDVEIISLKVIKKESKFREEVENLAEYFGADVFKSTL